ncbi:MAG: ABC transporter permease [Gemmatimonadales bacterium]
MSSLTQDLRYAGRALRRTPGFTVVAIVTLALGIGATTTIFTVVNGVLLRPLPYAAADRLANIWNDLGEGAQSLPAVSALDFRDYQARSRAFEEFAAASGSEAVNLRGNLTGDGDPERVDLSTVTANFFPLLGVTPALGRNFTPDEELANGPKVVLVGHDLWQRRYGGDSSLVGRTILVDGISHVVVGILPAGFSLLLPAEAFLVTDAEVWAPLQYDYGNAPPRNFTGFTVFGRLRSGLTWDQAQAEMDLIAGQLRSEHPVHAASNLRIRVVPLHRDVVKHARPALVVLMGAVGLVLLIACANVANLLLARATAREGEFALRAALGASRWAMVRQLLAESGLLAVAGAALGLGVTFWAMALLRALQPANLPRLGEIQVDFAVLAFALLVCLTTVVFFGLVPALRAAAADPQASLQSGTRASASPERQRMRNALIVAEVALSVVLLVGAGLLMRSFLALQQVRPGYDATDVLTFQLSMPASRYSDGEKRMEFFRRLEERLSALPGVRKVGQVSKLPLTGSGPLQPFAFNEETASKWESVTADERSISPGYFEAVNTRLLAGRAFTDRDVAGTPPLAIVDESLARLAWPGEEAVGKRLQVQPTGTPDAYVEVVGVVEHMRINSLSRATLPQIYWPMAQSPAVSISFVVETSVDPAGLAPSVRRVVSELDKDLPVTRLLPMSGYVSEGLAQARFNLILMAALGGIALALAAVGIFGVISYAVSQRTREFGIRMALGESPRHTRLSVVLRGMRLVALSLGLGLLASYGLSRLLGGLLYGVSPGDPLTLAAISVVLGVVALLACYLPARRATRVDPAIALRSE